MFSGDSKSPTSLTKDAHFNLFADYHRSVGSPSPIKTTMEIQRMVDGDWKPYGSTDADLVDDLVRIRVRADYGWFTFPAGVYRARGNFTGGTKKIGFMSAGKGSWGYFIVQ